MWRVLKLTAAIMGIILVTLTPLIQNARTPPDILPIVHIVNYHPEEGTSEVGETVQYWPTAPRNLIVNRRGMDGRLWHIAPSLDWALIFTGGSPEGTTDYYHVATTHATFEPIILGAVREQTVFWPDCDGMIYTTANPDGSLNYWVLYYPTETHWRINDLVQPYTALDGTAERLFWGDGRSVLSRDGRWLYLVQREPDGPYHIMALSVADKTITNLTADQAFLEMPHLRIPFNEWLIFRLGTRLHRLHRDGTGFGLLINDAWQPADPTQNEHSVREFEAWDVMVVGRDDQYVGVRVSTGEVLWEVGPDMINIWGTLSTPFTADGWLLSTYPSGKFNLETGRFVLNPNPPPRNYHQDRLSPDGTQLFYLEPNPTTGLNDLWRLDVLTGDQRLIRANIGDVVNYEIAPDSQHVVLAYPDYHLVYLDVASGAMWTLLDTPPFPTNFYDVVGWMHRFESTWQPSRLLVVDLALLIIGLIPRRLLQLRHTPPRSGRQNDAMPRLLKLATLLMGLLLLVVTVGLGSRRQTPFDDYVPVVMQPRQNDGTTRLVQVWSGSGAVLPITPGYVQDAQTLGVFDDGTTYAYAVGWHDYSVVDYMRASPNAPQGQRIVRNALYGSIMVSPDGKWVLYRQSDPSTGQPFVALNVETGQEWNITEIVRPVRVAFQGMHAFSRDGEWLFVSAVEASSIPKSRLMRIRLSDGTSETLPPAVTLPRTISILGQVGDWMMVLMEDRVYRQSIHQPIFEPLLTDTPVAQNSEYWLGGYDDLGVALLMRERHVLGVEVASRKILWAYTDLSLSLDSATKQGWMIGAYQSGFARIHLVTGEIQTPDWTTDAPGAYVLAQTTVDQWLIYAQWDDNDIMEWRRMNWVTHEDSLIRGNMYDANFIALSPDGRWILLTHSDGLYRLNVQDGSFQLLLPDQDFAMLAGWTRPFTRAWQPLALIAIAVALITLSILPRRLLQLMHRNPSSL